MRINILLYNNTSTFCPGATFPKQRHSLLKLLHTHPPLPQTITKLESKVEDTPGYGLRSPGQNSESVEAEEETFKDSLKMSIVSISGHSLYKGLF